MNKTKKVFHRLSASLGNRLAQGSSVEIDDGLTQNGMQIDEKVAKEYRAWCADNPPDDGYWTHWPMYYDEMPVSDELVEDAASRNDKAVMIIGRAAGEDRENKPEAGSWYLTNKEKEILVSLKKHFAKVAVILDCGSIMDVSFAKELDLDGLMFFWQGGQEMGNALYDVISGALSPSGKLTDTIAELESYPSTANFGNKEFNNYSEDIFVGYRFFETFAKDLVQYPFGFGLSYTSFAIEVDAVDDRVVAFHVTNTGSRAGKEVIQIYVQSAGAHATVKHFACNNQETNRSHNDSRLRWISLCRERIVSEGTREKRTVPFMRRFHRRKGLPWESCSLWQKTYFVFV